MIKGIDRITYGVEDMEACRRFLGDWGLGEVEAGADRALYETLDGCEVELRLKDDPTLPPAIEPGSTLREVVWGVEDDAALAAAAERMKALPGHDLRDGLPGCTDPVGLMVRVRVSRRRPVPVKGSPMNTIDQHLRVDEPSPVYERATPVKVGHVVLFTDRIDEHEAFYVDHLGFHASDRYPGRGVFLRCGPRGGHHDLFLLQLPKPKVGLNHIAFTVRDIHEVFGGGIHINRCGWPTEIGPGRHPISSAYFWYVKNPCGGLAEYYANEDWVTENWKPREFQPSPEMFAEWAVVGGIDGQTRRQTTR
ncbi:VOC family protein [Arenibaculum sp.]|uniref:VOC family protein n=1 Tax=Arenibaculum sp. TaxID=2865862 RepID=UPI002E157B30|nr:VOC family protein [Arenibaculum sp.]